MALLKADYPYPVLLPDNDDYVSGCRFSFEIGDAACVEGEYIVLPVSYELVGSMLNGFCSDGAAVVALSVESSSVSYNRLFVFSGDCAESVIKIPRLDVKDKIDVQCLVIAASELKIDGGMSDLNSDYFQNTWFSLEKGDVLAKTLVHTIYLDDTELEKPLASIFSINERVGLDCDLVPMYDQQKINIDVSPDLYRLYYDYAYKNGGVLERFATGAIVFPVLVDAINLIRSRSDDENDARWCRSIIAKCEKLSIDVRSDDVNAATLADKLLGGISLGCMKAFDESANDGVNSGEFVEERSTD
ncbi:MAG: hypothetical protein KH142_05315 [Slackia piriformis]|uniref:Uncharacterized protein n=1 Tax=Slackia piriformis TaxID=626934 RepID=A0A943UTA5_9ACTN|nr:hypothetical protein [Slackia piriformis]